jgi:aspartate aminotransferase
LLLTRFAAIPGLRTPKPEGAFYLFPDVRDFMGRTTLDGTTIADDVALASYLLNDGVAVVPGSGFGMPGFLRLSYATSDEALNLAADRLSGALGRLS